MASEHKDTYREDGIKWEVLARCPFPDCDWTFDRPVSADGRHGTVAETRAERHYNREHTGEIKLRAVFTKTITTTHNDAQELSDDLHDRLLGELPVGMELAFTAAEVVEEADDHSEVEDGE